MLFVQHFCSFCITKFSHYFNKFRRSIPEVKTFSHGLSALYGPFILHMMLAVVQPYEREYFYGYNKLKTFPSWTIFRIQLPT